MKPSKPVTCLALIGAVLVLSACSISRSVTPVQPGVVIDTLHVVHNPQIHMKGFEPEMVRQITALGVPVQVVTGDMPDGARFTMTYTANWAWDLAMYLTFFEATLFENGRVIGSAKYDSRSGGARLDKFGATADLIRPLLNELFAGVQRPPVNPEG